MHPHLHAQNRTVKSIYSRSHTCRASERVSEHKCVRTYVYRCMCTRNKYTEPSETQNLGMRQRQREKERAKLQNGTKNQSDWRRWIDGIRIRLFRMYTHSHSNLRTHTQAQAHAHAHIIIVIVVVVVVLLLLSLFERQKISISSTFALGRSCRKTDSQGIHVLCCVFLVAVLLNCRRE